MTGIDTLGLTQEKVLHSDVAWRSIISPWKSRVFGVVERAQSPSEKWKQLCSYDQAEGLKEQRRLQRELGTMALEPAEDPDTFIRRIDRIVSKVKILGTGIHENTENIYIIKGLADEYDTHRKTPGQW